MTIIQLRRLVAQKTKAYRMLNALADQKEKELIKLEIQLEWADQAMMRATRSGRTRRHPSPPDRLDGDGRRALVWIPARNRPESLSATGLA